MMLNTKIHNYYKTLFNDLLQSNTALIRKFYTTWSNSTPQLKRQVDHLWELSQRQRLIAGVSEEAADALISNCHDTYQTIYQIIGELSEEQLTLSIELDKFERLKHASTEKFTPLNQQDGNRPTSLDCWSLWLSNSLCVIQTLTKYLKLQARLLQPTRVNGSTVEQFKKDLQLADDNRANLCIGLAKSERILWFAFYHG